MRTPRAPFAIVLVLLLVAAAAATAAAQPTGAGAPPAPAATAAPTEPAQSAYFPPPNLPAPAPEPPRRSWFGLLGLGGMGYVGREYTPYDDGNKGSGAMLEALAGKWIRDDAAVGLRVEAHTDDAQNYTDSSITVLARFGVGTSERFYLEPAIGLAFHKDEMYDQTENGFAAAMTAGYHLTRSRFACDLRFGGAHYRFDPDLLTHGLLWVGIGLGFQ